MPQKNSHLTPEILKMRAAGATYREIRDALGVSINQVIYWCSPNGRRQRIAEATRRRERSRFDAPVVPPDKNITALVNYRMTQLALKRARRTVSRTRQTGKEFTLSEAEILKLSSQRYCVKTGIEFEEAGDLSLSFDRIDSSLGYVSGNVQAVCWIYNRAKGAGSDEALLAVARALVAQADRWD